MTASVGHIMAKSSRGALFVPFLPQRTK